MIFDEVSAAVDWLLAPDARREIEVGCSRAKHLVRAARGRLGSRLLGVEMWPDKCRDAGDRIERAGVLNAAILCARAGPVLEQALPPLSVDCIHIYYPTPNSMKVPGRARRAPPLLDMSRLAAIHRVLRRGGELRLVTDDRRYYRQVVAIAQRLRWVCLPWRAPAGLGLTQAIGTGCESQYSNDPRRSPLTLRLLRA